MAALYAAVKARGEPAVREFWEEVGRTGTPIVEPTSWDPEEHHPLPVRPQGSASPVPLSKKYALLTFLWRSKEPVTVVLQDVSLAQDVGSLTLQRLLDTDVWF
ncbi:MAG: hypothetical protein M3O85_06125, partial [Acidobacteriota bacterium]|nr:hypothetical protein [Acidobacteriota bacterium]